MKNFDLIIGYEDVKAELKMALDTIKNPEKYKMLGVKPSRGILLHGHPGVGKTVLAKAFLEASGRKYFICRKSGSKNYLGSIFCFIHFPATACCHK